MDDPDDRQGDEPKEHQRALKNIGPDHGQEAATDAVGHDHREADRDPDIIIPAKEIGERLPGREDLRRDVNRHKDG